MAQPLDGVTSSRPKARHLLNASQRSRVRRLPPTRLAGAPRGTDSGIGIPGDELSNSFQGFSPPGRGLAVQRRSGRPIDHGRSLIKTSVR
jgi:hypothetical protein